MRVLSTISIIYFLRQRYQIQFKQKSYGKKNTNIKFFFAYFAMLVFTIHCMCYHTNNVTRNVEKKINFYQLDILREIKNNS